MPSTTAFAKYGFGASIGLLVMGWASQAYLWYGYQRANPDIGAISTSPGHEFIIAGLFVIGCVVAFTSFFQGLEYALDVER
jgi:hypothetical protein